MLSYRSALARLVDLLFPPQCVSCDQIGYLFCPACSQEVQPAVGSSCQRCGRFQAKPVDRCGFCLRIESWSLTWVRAAALLTEPLRTAIHAFKYEGREELAYALSRYLVAAYHRPPWTELSPPLDGVVPVPLHIQRYHERGYNQAQLVATAFSRRMRIPLCDDLLQRTYFRSTQVGLTFEERQSNVENAFQAVRNPSGKRLLLIDDVYTTGATLNSCARTLLDAGALSVYALTLAMPAQTYPKE